MERVLFVRCLYKILIPATIRPIDPSKINTMISTMPSTAMFCFPSFVLAKASPVFSRNRGIQVVLHKRVCASQPAPYNSAVSIPDTSSIPLSYHLSHSNIISTNSKTSSSIEERCDIIDAVFPSIAEEMLGVSRGRVSQMIKSGQLIAHKTGTDTYVDLTSINERIASAPKSGRPQKSAVA